MECLAVVWAVLMIRPCLKESGFTIRTDHDALGSILNMADATGRLALRPLRISELELDVVYRAVVNH